MEKITEKKAQYSNKYRFSWKRLEQGQYKCIEEREKKQLDRKWHHGYFEREDLDIGSIFYDITLLDPRVRVKVYKQYHRSLEK